MNFFSVPKSSYLGELGTPGKHDPNIIVEVHVWNTPVNRCRDPPDRRNVDFTCESRSLAVRLWYRGVTSIELILCQRPKLNPLVHGGIIYHPSIKDDDIKGKSKNTHQNHLLVLEEQVTHPLLPLPRGSARCSEPCRPHRPPTCN